jgi:hypothetical protein
VQSIYGYELDYRQKAQAAAEEYVAALSSEMILRWRAVRIDPANFLTGSYLINGSMPKTFQISPFPDTVFIVSETDYTIWEINESASWKGSIVGSDDGRVEISIVGGVTSPGFVIRIFDGPSVIGIAPLEGADQYIAMEGNPHAPAAIL